VVKKKDFPPLSGWGDSSPNENYELKYLRIENQKLKEEVESLSHNKMDKNMERDIAALLQISMKMKYLLEQCRSQTMLPIELGRQIDRVIKEIENYG
jgi:hypothetical protein